MRLKENRRLIELRTLVLLLGWERGSFEKLLPLFQPHRIYLIMKDEEFYTAEDWETLNKYIKYIKEKRDPETVKEIRIPSYNGKVDFADAFATILDLMQKEKNEKYKVIVAISGGSRFLIYATIISAAITQSEIYYMSVYAKSAREREPAKEQSTSELRKELINIPAFPIGLPKPTHRLILMSLLDRDADSNFVTMSVKDLLKDIGAQQILGEERLKRMERKRKGSSNRAASVMLGSALKKLKNEGFIKIDAPEARRKRIKLTPRGRLMAITVKTLARTGHTDCARIDEACGQPIRR